MARFDDMRIAKSEVAGSFPQPHAVAGTRGTFVSRGPPGPLELIQQQQLSLLISIIYRRFKLKLPSLDSRREPLRTPNAALLMLCPFLVAVSDVLIALRLIGAVGGAGGTIRKNGKARAVSTPPCSRSNVSKSKSFRLLATSIYNALICPNNRHSYYLQNFKDYFHRRPRAISFSSKP